MSRSAHAIGLEALRSGAARRQTVTTPRRHGVTTSRRRDGAIAGAIISPGDYLARLEQINTYIRELDRDYAAAYRAQRITREQREAWNRWFGDWTEFFAINDHWVMGLTGGALEQAEERLRVAQEWRARLEAAGVRPTAPSPNIPPTLGESLTTWRTPLLVGAAVAGILGVALLVRSVKG